MEAMKKPTIGDNEISPWLELLCIPLNHFLAPVVQAVRILY